ncbi:hypothetical protein EON64_20925 [archaeon]|nr:MAG: hypothetical protein EON64_20925 [archaeon]
MERDLKTFAAMLPADVVVLLETNVQEGLDQGQVSARIAVHGPNKLEEGEKVGYVSAIKSGHLTSHLTPPPHPLP